MQRIIQINLAKRLLPIEEDAYTMLRDYIQLLERHFREEPGKDEIIEDIQYRIAELFSVRLETGTPCIDTADVKTVIETLGPAYTLGSESSEPQNPYLPELYSGKQYGSRRRRLYRNPHDKVLGGVCSGVANYFDIDPVIVRLIMVILFFSAGIGLLAYIIAWIVIPAARTPIEMAELTGGDPMDFETLKGNLHQEMQDMKKRAEDMSRDLRGFFNRRK